MAGLQSTNVTLMDGSSLNIRLSAGIAAAMNINAYVEMDAFLQSALQAMLNSKKEGDEPVVVNHALAYGTGDLKWGGILETAAPMKYPSTRYCLIRSI